jgi:hypothetical protein
MAALVKMVGVEGVGVGERHSRILVSYGTLPHQISIFWDISEKQKTKL